VMFVLTVSTGYKAKISVKIMLSVVLILMNSGLKKVNKSA
jgi:hypothetical protein